MFYDGLFVGGKAGAFVEERTDLALELVLGIVAQDEVVLDASFSCFARRAASRLGIVAQDEVVLDGACCSRFGLQMGVANGGEFGFC